MRRSPDAGPISKIARATHGKPASCKLRNTLLGYIKKQLIVEFMLLHSKNALEIILEDPNIQNFSGGTSPGLGLCQFFVNKSLNNREKREKFE